MSKRKRLLTEAEIEDIVSFIPKNPYIPEEISQNITDAIKKDFVKQLETCLIFPILIPKLKRTLKKLFYASKAKYGETVGHVTSMSLGEKQTQSNLNYFHKAGSGDKKISATSRFSDLLNATNKLKNLSFSIYMIEQPTSIKQLRNIIGSSIVELSMKKLTKKFSIHSSFEEKPWYKAYYQIYQKEEPDFELGPHITYFIDMDLLFEYKLTLNELCESLENSHSDIICIPSPDCFGQIDFYPNSSKIELKEESLAYITQENKDEIYLEDTAHPILETTILKGIQGVKNIYYLRSCDPPKDIWYLETENQNEKNQLKKKFSKVKIKTNDSVKRFKSVLSLPFVDKTKTVSNNIWDIYHVLGIEAVRTYMIDQFEETMKGINICHIALLVDKMTFTGSICSVSRYSMKHEGGVLQKSSFEETLVHFMNAGLYQESDPIKGISAAIICGKRVNAGSGVCELEMNLDKIEEKDDKETCDIGDISEESDID